MLTALMVVTAACRQQASPGAGAQKAPAPVEIAAAQQRPVPVEVEAIGTVTPVRTIAVRSRVDGRLERVFFREGDEVAAGAPLFLIDPRPFQLALSQAQANRLRDQAQLRNAEADARRYRQLVSRSLVSRQDYDLRAAQAAALRATVESDRAAVNAAQVNLGYTLIRSPISGRTGSLMIDLGNLIKAQDAIPMVIIRQLRPIEVSFSVPAAHLSRIRTGASRSPLPVVASVAGRPPARGTLTFVDNTVDPATGTILLKGTFPNADEILWPGQFASTRLVLAVRPDAVLVPARAVQPGQQGDHVFVVETGDVAQVRRVQAGERLGSWVAVSDVRPGERVVTDGFLGLVPGTRVHIQGTAAGSPPGPGETLAGDRGPSPPGPPVQGRRP